MPIGNIANIPDSDQSWNQWTFSLQAEIRDINRAIYQQRQIALPEYILDPLDRVEPGVQLEQLQDNLDLINEVLNIPGYDYEDIDLNNRGELTSWVFLLFTNLLAASNQLGVG